MNKFLLLSAAVALMGGCTLAPKYTRPAPPVPAALPSGPAYGPTSAAEPAGAASSMPWQEFIADQRLQKVIAMALEGNRDLRLAALNVERARALYGVERAAVLPTVGVTASGGEQRVPGDLSATGRAMTTEQYSVNLGIASWEIDFFGRIRSLKAAALQQYLATEQARCGVQILLVSGVANAYLTLAADREILKLAQTTLETQQGVYDLVKRRCEGGLVPELDVHRARVQVDTARRDVARFTQQVARDENAMTLLVGSPVPDELMPADLGSVTPPKEISPGLSSDVLLHRPDILGAEAVLKAAHANIGAARAAFFPSISLTTTIGTASADLSGLFKSGSGTWSYAPQILLPIFNPQTWFAARVSRVDREIAIVQYEQAIQASFREVSDALAIRGSMDQEVSAQESLVQEVTEVSRLSETRYAKGIDSYLGVLDAQRSMYAAQQVLVTLRLARVTNQVTLYTVLGGGGKP